MDKRKRLLITAAGLLIIIIVVLLLSFRNAIFGEPGEPEASDVDTLVIEEGASAYRVAYQLQDQGLLDDPRSFGWYLRLRGNEHEIHAGTYIIPHSASSGRIAAMLTSGRVARVKVTFPEGWTARQMAARLDEEQVVDSAVFIDSVRSESFTASLRFDELPTLDGLLFPETYVFEMNSEPSSIIREMVSQFRARMGEEWFERARDSEYGLRGTLTLASIIEGEMKNMDEAADIASVYKNRLHRGMKLQADPTVQYLLPGEPRRLLLEDLEIDSPYNTYKYVGLPPGPINNPGERALRAALGPPEHDWLFMVATGDGGHTFTTNLVDHLRAKEEFDKVRRKVARERRQNGE